MKTKIASVLAVLALANVAVAETDGFKISGDFAASYFKEDGKGNNAGFPTAGAIGNGENDGNFSMDLVEINVEKAVGNSSVVLGIGYGRIFDSINSVVDSNLTAATPGGTILADIESPRSTLNLTNAFFMHKLGDTGLSFRIGKFESFMGHETYNYMDNMNYTRGYAFYYTMPFYLTGLNVNYAINDMIDVGVYAANTTSASDIDDNRNKVLGAAVNIKPMEGLGIKLNYLGGTEGGDRNGIPATGIESDLTIMNAIVSYNMNNMDFAVQWVNRTTELVDGSAEEIESSVIGLYAGYKADVWGAGLRYEMADYDQGSSMDVTGTGGTALAAGEDNTINTFTLSGWYDIDQNARLKVDVAQHSSDKQVFGNDEGTGTEDSLMVYGLGLAYRF